MENHKILIAGSGGIGKAVGLILACSKEINTQIITADREQEIADGAAQYINEGSQTEKCQGIVLPSSDEDKALVQLLTECSAILDCLPGSLAPRVARLAQKHNCHYINLTEYVKETEQVTEIANQANTGFVLQTGLAPGYINVLGNHLFKKFTSLYQVDKVDALEMKVGALSKNARTPYFYAFTWSPIGVATEYVKDAIVVQDYETKYIPSLSNTETLLLDGIAYEDDYTSGGAADLPLALAGKVKDLNYKTLRYPGHYNWARQIILNTPEGSDKVEHLHNTMMDNIPSVEDDVVIVYASVKGKDDKGRLRAIEKSLHIYPSTVGNKALRAIQTTTAAPMCEALRMLLAGDLKGPIFQSQLNTDEFLNGPFVKAIYGAID